MKKSRLHFTGNQHGFALITTILLLLVLGVMIATATNWSAMDVKRTTKYTQTREAFYIAEAGVQHALHHFNWSVDGESPGAAGNGFDDELNGTSTDWGPFTDIPFEGGTYTVTLEDNDDGNDFIDSDNTIILHSVGRIGGVTSEVEAIIYRGKAMPGHAVITEEDLKVHGGIKIIGKEGSAHSNANLDHEGNSGDIVKGSTATLTCAGDSCNGPFPADSEFLIPFDPMDFKKYANYIFKYNGEIDEMNLSNDPPTVTVTYAANSHPWSKVAKKPGYWEIHGEDAPQNAILFIEGDIKISATSTLVTSIIATGYISLGGGASITNYRNPDQGKSIQDLMFMAGTDFQVIGNVSIGKPGHYQPGFMMVADQIKLEGNVYMDGWIQAGSVGGTSEGLVTTNDIGGNWHLRFNGGPPGPYPGQVKLMSWREISVVS